VVQSRDNEGVGIAHEVKTSHNIFLDDYGAGKNKHQPSFQINLKCFQINLKCFHKVAPEFKIYIYIYSMEFSTD